VSARAFALVLLLAPACDDEIIPPRVPQKTAQHEASPAERREAACKAKELPGVAPAKGGAELTADLPQGTVGKVEVEGADDPRFRAAIGIAPGDPLSLGKTQDAIRHLYELGEFDDVRLEARSSPQGIVVRFIVQKRASLGEIVIHSGSVYDTPELEKAFHATSGARYDPVSLVSVRATLASALREKGYIDAALNITGARGEGGPVDLCIDLQEGHKVTIDSIGFKGLARLKEDDLKPLIDTDHGRINTAGGVLDSAKIDEAISKMAEVLDAHGLAKGVIQMKSPRTGDKLAIVFEVEEGPVFVLRRYEVKGDLATDAGAYKKILSLKSKDPFSRAKLLADLQKINDLHQKQNKKDLQIQPKTDVDDKNNTVDVVLVIVDPKKQAPPPPPPKK
jgi:outer membrane protein insertion porin family